MNASLMSGNQHIHISKQVTLSAEPCYAKGREISIAIIPNRKQFFKDFFKMCQIKHFILIRGVFHIINYKEPRV